MNCALCLEDRPLCRSHIVPEFMFKPMYDAKHQFWQMSSLPEKPNRPLQKGLRERLLCEACEQQIGRYEDYAGRVFFGSATDKPVRVQSGFVFADLKYKPLKLFFMSLLWRFSVTAIPTFGKTDLGPHGERLRKLISDDDAGTATCYPCTVSALLRDRTFYPDLIIPPMFTRFQGLRVWAFVVAGFLFQFFVSKGSPPRSIKAAFLQEDGQFFLHVVDYRESRFVSDWLTAMGAAERKRTALAST